MKLSGLLFCFQLFYFNSAGATGTKVLMVGSSEGQPFEVVQRATGFNVPWGFDFLDDERLILTERRGNLFLWSLKTGHRTPILGFPPVMAKGQGGLLDVLVDRSADTKAPWVYVTYSHQVSSGKSATVLGRFQVTKQKVTQFQKLLVTKSAHGTSHHFGSRIAIDDKGLLYFSVGDRGTRKNAQDLKTHSGSILRVHKDGRVPKDNPFVNSPNHLPEIWSYGHRNPQGLVFDKVRQGLWAIEHGPRGGDELNWILKGKNYGWPIVSHGKEYALPLAVGEGTHKQGMEDSVHYYVPSIAPSSLAIYSGSYFPRWKGHLFSGALKLTHLNRIVIKGGKFLKEERLLEKLGRRLRNVKQTPRGTLLISTDRGELLEIQPLRKGQKNG